MIQVLLTHSVNKVINFEFC